MPKPAAETNGSISQVVPRYNIGFIMALSKLSLLTCDQIPAETIVLHDSESLLSIYLCMTTDRHIFTFIATVSVCVGLKASRRQKMTLNSQMCIFKLTVMAVV